MSYVVVPSLATSAINAPNGSQMFINHMYTENSAHAMQSDNELIVKTCTPFMFDFVLSIVTSPPAWGDICKVLVL